MCPRNGRTAGHGPRVQEQFRAGCPDQPQPRDLLSGSCALNRNTLPSTPLGNSILYGTDTQASLMGTVKSSFPFAQLFEDIYRLRTGFNLSKKISCQIDTMKRIGISRYTLLLYYGSYSVWTSHFKNPSARLPKASVRISPSLKFNAFPTKNQQETGECASGPSRLRRCLRNSIA